MLSVKGDRLLQRDISFLGTRSENLQWFFKFRLDETSSITLKNISGNYKRLCKK